MLSFPIIKLNGVYYIVSCFGKQRYAVPHTDVNMIKSALESIDRFYVDVEQRITWYGSTRWPLTKYKQTNEVSIQLLPFKNSTHPLSLNVGPAYGNYHYLLEIGTFLFSLWFYCVLPSNKAKKGKEPQLTRLNEINRHKYFTICGITMKVMRIEEHKQNLDITNKPSSMIINMEITDDDARSQFDSNHGDDNDDVVSTIISGEQSSDTESTTASLGGMKAKKEKKALRIKKFKAVKKNIEKAVMICYDVETITINKILYPFVISARSDYDEHRFLWKLNTTITDISIEGCMDGVKQFVTWLYAEVTRIGEFRVAFDMPEHDFVTVRLFGFNCHSFDNHFFYNEMRTQFFKYKMHFNSRYGKTTEVSFMFRGMRFYISDLIKWFPAQSLSSACKAFGVKMAKYDIAITTYCHACSEVKRIIEYCDNPEIYFKDTIDDQIKQSFFGKYYDTETKLFAIYQLIVDYCIRDVDATYELYTLFDKVLQDCFDEFAEEKIHVPYRDIFNYVSPSQMSFIIIKEYMVRQKQGVLLFNDPAHHEFIYASYLGGRCDYTCIGEVEPTNDSEYIYMDVTSEYPTTMKGLFPDVSDPNSILIDKAIDMRWLQSMLDDSLAIRNKLFNEKRLHLSTEYLHQINKIKGIFRCNITPPENKTEMSTWAPVGTRIYVGQITKLYFLNYAQQNRILNTSHMQALILAGWHIEIVPDKFNILFTKLTYTLKEYIVRMGQKKTESVNNKAKRNFFKLCLNGPYGKFAQKPKHVLHLQESTHGLINVNEKTIENDWSASYHYLSTFITGYSNWIIFSKCYFAELEQIYDGKSIAERVNTVLYTDTDSIILNKDKCSSFLTFNISEEIGGWNEETSDFDATWKAEEYGEPIKSLIVLGKKTYFCIGKDKTLLNIKAKGIHDHIAKKLTYDEIKKIASGVAKKFAFEGLIKKKKKIEQSSLSFEISEASFTEDISKEIQSAIIKKTLTKDSIIPVHRVECQCEKTMTTNLKYIDKHAYTNEINHFLEFTSSPFVNTITSMKKTNSSFELEINTTSGNPDDEEDEDYLSDHLIIDEDGE